MSKKIFVVLGVLAFVSSAYAGLAASQGVVLSTTQRFAFGSLNTARNSSDSSQAIGCETYVSGSDAVSIYCYARDWSNHSGGCFTSDARLVQVAATLGYRSYVQFDWDSWGNCTSLYVINSAEYQ